MKKMDVCDIIRGDSLTIDVVKNSPTKRAVIISGGAMVTMKDNQQKFNILVEIDGKQRNWKPNRPTLRNLAEKFGNESSRWIGKSVAFQIGIINGKEATIGQPI